MVCSCDVVGRGTYPQDEEDSIRNMKMKSVSTSNGFFRVCTMCDKPLYLRDGKGPYDRMSEIQRREYLGLD